MEKIAKALGAALSDFFTDEDVNNDINSYDSSMTEKVKAIEALNDKEKKTVFSIVDAFAGKRKLKDALSNVLQKRRETSGILPGNTVDITWSSLQIAPPGETQDHGVSPAETSFFYIPLSKIQSC